MNAMTEQLHLSNNVIGGLVSSAVLIDLNISVWVGRKTDKKNTKKVVEEAGAKFSDSAHVTKKLFVDNPKLDEVMRKGSAARAYVADNTLPWMGDLKLLPMSAFLRVTQDLAVLHDAFQVAVDDFLSDYDLQVSAMAFKNGSLFDRKEYPGVSELRHKFDMTWNILPLPDAGDFRVDAEAALRKNLEEAYTKAMNTKITEAMTLMWGRLKDCLTHMVDRLGTSEDGKPNIFRDTMLGNAKELVNLLKDFNLANDPEMERTRQQLHAVIDHVEPGELRTNKAVREDVRKNVADILSKFQM